MSDHIVYAKHMVHGIIKLYISKMPSVAAACELIQLVVTISMYNVCGAHIQKDWKNHLLQRPCFVRFSFAGRAQPAIWNRIL